MGKIETEQQYNAACARIEELLQIVGNDTPTDDQNYIELDLISDLVADYEEEHMQTNEDVLFDVDAQLDGMFGKEGTPSRKAAENRANAFFTYKGYKGSVEYSKEDNCLCGKVLGMSKDLIAYEGNTIDELRKDFEAGVDSYLEGCPADGVEP